MRRITTHTVNASLTGSDGNLSVLGVFQLLQNAVTELMGEAKIDGFTAKREYNAVWVFAKSRIKMIESVAWNGQRVTVETFLSQRSRAGIAFDVAMKKENGNLCAYARVELCALDLQTGRIRRVETVGLTEAMQPEEPSENVSFTRFTQTDYAECERVHVKYTNIDYLHHTNNVEYVRFLLNTYTVREMEDRPIKEMEMVFVNQSFEGDELSISRAREHDKDAFLIQKDGTIIVKSEILF